ncbi:hypothetical protein MHIMP23_04600 [Methylobacterium hispanicum]
MLASSVSRRLGCLISPARSRSASRLPNSLISAAAGRPNETRAARARSGRRIMPPDRRRNQGLRKAAPGFAPAAGLPRACTSRPARG